MSASKYLKRATMALVLGGLFGAGVVGGGYFTFKRIMTPKSDEEFIKQIIAEEESDMGMSCGDVSTEALIFVNENVEPIIEAGRAGKDWVTYSTNSLLNNLKRHREKTFKCHLLKENAWEYGVNVEGEFETMHELFSALEIFLTPWGGESPSAKSLKPGAFEKVNQLYSNLTTGSSGDAQTPRAP